MAKKDPPWDYASPSILGIPGASALPGVFPPCLWAIKTPLHWTFNQKRRLMIHRGPIGECRRIHRNERGSKWEG